MSTTVSSSIQISHQPLIPGFRSIGSEVFGNICRYLDFKDVVNLSTTSKSMHTQVNAYTSDLQNHKIECLLNILMNALKQDPKQTDKIRNYQVFYLQNRKTATSLTSLTQTFFKVGHWAGSFFNQLPLSSLVKSAGTISELNAPQQLETLRYPGNFHSYCSFQKLYTLLDTIPSIVQRYQHMKFSKPISKPEIIRIKKLVFCEESEGHSLVSRSFSGNSRYKPHSFYNFGLIQASIDIVSGLPSTPRSQLCHKIATHLLSFYSQEGSVFTFHMYSDVERFFEITYLNHNLAQRHSIQFKYLKKLQDQIQMDRVQNLSGSDQGSKNIELFSRAMDLFKFKPGKNHRDTYHHQQDFDKRLKELLECFLKQNSWNCLSNEFTLTHQSRLSLTKMVKFYNNYDEAIKYFEAGELDTLLYELLSQESRCVQIFLGLHILLYKKVDSRVVEFVYHNCLHLYGMNSSGSATQCLSLLIFILIQKGCSQTQQIHKLMKKLENKTSREHAQLVWTQIHEKLKNSQG